MPYFDVVDDEAAAVDVTAHSDESNGSVDVEQDAR